MPPKRRSCLGEDSSDSDSDDKIIKVLIKEQVTVTSSSIRSIVKQQGQRKRGKKREKIAVMVIMNLLL